MAVLLSLYLFVNKNNRELWSPGPERIKTKSTPVKVTVISDGRDGVSSNLVANLGRTVHNTLDDWSVSNSSNRSKNGGSVGQGTVQEDLGVSLPLLPLSNDGLISSRSSRSSKDGETMIGQWMGGVSSIGEGMGVCDREGRRVVDERSGGRDHSAGSSQDGGLGISGPLAVVTIGVTIVTSVASVASVTVSVVAIVSISISLWLSISRSLAIVAKAVVANSDRDGVSGHFMLNLGRSDNIRLHNWNMSNSANSGTNVGHPSSVG